MKTKTLFLLLLCTPLAQGIVTLEEYKADLEDTSKNEYGDIPTQEVNSAKAELKKLNALSTSGAGADIKASTPKVDEHIQKKEYLEAFKIIFEAGGPGKAVLNGLEISAEFKKGNGTVIGLDTLKKS